MSDKRYQHDTSHVTSPLSKAHHTQRKHQTSKPHGYLEAGKIRTKPESRHGEQLLSPREMPRYFDALGDVPEPEEKARKLAKTNAGNKVTPEAPPKELQNASETSSANAGMKHPRDRAGTTTSMSSTGTPRNRADPEGDITDPDFQTTEQTPNPTPPEDNTNGKPSTTQDDDEDDDLYAKDDRENTPRGAPTGSPPGSPNTRTSPQPLPQDEGSEMLLARIKRLPQEITDDEFISRAQEGNAQLAQEPEESPSHANLVPTPLGGWPTVHGRVPTLTIGNVDPQQVQLYVKEMTRVMVAQPLGANSWDATKSGDIANAIAEEIRSSFNAPTVAVSPANEDKPPTGPNDPPYSFFVSDITDETYWALHDKECIASKNIQFIIRPLKRMGPNSYMGCIMGLVNVQNLTDRREDQLLDDLRELLYKNTAFYDATLNIALTYISTLPQPSSPPPGEEADVDMSPENDPDYFVHDLLGDLKIEVIPIKTKNGTPKPAVNLYLRIPGASIVSVLAVKNTIANDYALSLKSPGGPRSPDPPHPPPTRPNRMTQPTRTPPKAEGKAEEGEDAAETEEDAAETQTADVAEAHAASNRSR
ncbi:hypothetical protein HWV62_16240 [Athelia sp. TMB]|nr:hypothetical protein HWV62_16240 [Athelia sp. TMB]